MIGRSQTRGFVCAVLLGAFRLRGLRSRALRGRGCPVPPYADEWADFVGHVGRDAA